MIIGEKGFIELKIQDFDCNVADGITVSMDVNHAKLSGVSFCTIAKTGTHATHVVGMQYSPDDTNWYDSIDASITGVGYDVCDCSMRYVRCKLTTVEGSASTVDIIIQAR